MNSPAGNFGDFLEATFWKDVDDAVSRFVQLWRDKLHPDLAPLVPDRSHPHRKRILAALLAVDLELSWREGQRRDVESYLTTWDELAGDTEQLAEVVVAECRVREIHGRPVTPEELQARFSPAVCGLVNLDEIRSEVRPHAPREPSRLGLVDDTSQQTQSNTVAPAPAGVRFP